MKNRTVGEMCKAYEQLMQQLRSCGLTIRKHILDKEASGDYLQAIKKTRQRVPKSTTKHAQEKCRGKSNKHLQKTILAGVDQTFPLHLWDHLLLQAESTLNMMWPTNIAPMVFAYTYMYGQHDYNKMPMAPMGCAALIHVKPNIRKTWDCNVIDGYYLGKSQEQYRCYKVWVKQTQSIRVKDMTFFKHQYITMPTCTKADAIMAVV